jgi:thioester reductase-like protein
VSHQKFVLLTGATGVVGSALRPRLAGHRVISLTHRSEVDGEYVHGDVAQPRLGLDQHTYRDLLSTVDTVVHCAAVTDFAAGAEAANRFNVTGTRNVLDFAADAGARLIHVSTAFVARSELTRSAQGASLRDAAARPEDYLDSKREAEDILRGSGVPTVIARPSVVIGDSVTGEMARFQGIHTIASSVIRGRLPLVPFDPASRVDVIPQNLVAAGLATLVDSGTATGEYWLTAGPYAMTAGRIIEMCVEFAGELGLKVSAPRLVKPDMVDRLIRPVFIDPLPAAARRRFDDLLAMAALFAGAEPFPTSLGEPLPVDLPSERYFESAFRASLAYLARTKRMGKKLAVAA